MARTTPSLSGLPLVTDPRAIPTLFVGRQRTGRWARFCEGANRLRGSTSGCAVVFGGAAAFGWGLQLPVVFTLVAGVAAVGLGSFTGMTSAFNQARRQNAQDTLPFHAVSYVAGVATPLIFSALALWGVHTSLVTAPAEEPAPKVVRCYEGGVRPAPESMRLLKRRGFRVDCPPQAGA